MANKGIFPAEDAEFNEYLQRGVPHLIENWARLVPAPGGGPPPPIPIVAPAPIPDSPSSGATTAVPTDPRKVQLTELFGQWNIKYPQSQNPDTRTSTITNEKNSLRKEIEILLRNIFADIPESWLTEQDREIFNLKQRDSTPTTVQPMSYAPDIDIEKIEHLQHTLRFADPQNPHTQAQPAGQQIEVERMVGNAGLNESQINFGNAVITGKFLHIISFTAAEVGKTAYYRCSYITNTGKRGPWSAMTSAVIA